METLSNDDEKVEGNSLKRKMLKIDTEEKTESSMEKKKKLSGVDKAMAIVELIFQPDLYHISNNSDKSGQPIVQPKDQEIIEKPKLIVKEKKKISYIAHDVFPLFISLCIQRSNDKDRKDMEKIVNKLKRRYEELDLEYTSSEYFVSFINEKRAAIMNNDKKIYVYIEEVMNEMKRRIKKKPHILPSNETYDAVPSTSYASNNLSINDAAKSDYNNDKEENANPKTRSKIKLLLQTMASCEEKIKKLEEAEVDLDEENSSYIQVERDILECVSRCNDRKNLGLDRRKQQQLAKKAFIELGELLQRTRRNDYWDTFSLHLENTAEDPATKDKDLAKKLIDNRTEGEKRLAAVFEKYTKKQEEVKEQNDIDTTSEGEEESIVDDENKSKDELSVSSLSEEDSNNEENMNTKVKDNRLFIENAKENNMVVPKNKNQTTNEITVHEVCSSNIVTQNIVDAKTPEDSLPTCSTADCTNNISRIEEDLPEMITEDMSKVIGDPVIETATEDAADVIPRAVVEPITEDVTEDVTEVITGDETEVITEDATEDVTAIENQREEEKKPLLRVRSFAKPPTTWEVDSRQKIVKTAQENASKVTNQLKEVVDLTNEATVTNKTSPVTKCTIQLGGKVNTRTGQIIAPVRDVSSSTIIRLPSAQTTVTRQNQPQNPVTARNEVPFRGNETILRIIQQGKPIIVSNKSGVQSVPKQINVHLPKTKPK
ncbi:death domain-associated protein 6 [Lasius niger]|uniref:Death domain-associated protein 6 n=1 Tax=Lasius niger TaxID=67767 RepID=A0A0J7L9M4_LASNI|nr:death domain-associated protein 6 [Lasius niger]